MIITEKARLRALRERRTIPSPSGKSAAQSASGKAYDPESVGKKRGSEQSDRYRKSTAQSASGKAHDPSASEKSTVRVLREKRGPSVSGKVHDPESVGKKRGSERSGKGAQSRVRREKARLRVFR